MLACWSTNPEDRPSFQVLNDLLLDMEKNERPYVNVDPSQEISLPPDEGIFLGLLSFKAHYFPFLTRSKKVTVLNYAYLVTGMLVYAKCFK